MADNQIRGEYSTNRPASRVMEIIVRRSERVRRRNWLYIVSWSTGFRPEVTYEWPVNEGITCLVCEIDCANRGSRYWSGGWWSRSRFPLGGFFIFYSSIRAPTPYVWTLTLNPGHRSFALNFGKVRWGKLLCQFAGELAALVRGLGRSHCWRELTGAEAWIYIVVKRS